MSIESELPFTYDKMRSWHDTLRVRTLEPALKTAERYLMELIESEVTDFDRLRIKLRPGRIKSTARLWEKMNQPKYVDQISALDDIPQVIDDLVGLRVVCNNSSDIDTVQHMLLSLPDLDDDEAAPFSVISAKERNYHKDPKESGYRAYHINLSVRVASGVAGWSSVSVELQVRTLLQDGWGELTHEDTYKPGTELPQLISTLARRMANLLGCVDEIAQDLRDVLDQQGSLRLTETPDESSVDEQSADATDENRPALSLYGHLLQTWQSSPQSWELSTFRELFPEEALIEETRALVANLDRPAPLASIALKLQSLFGNHISRQHWGRFGSFKALLMHAVPGVRIENIGPGWIVPTGFTRDDIPNDEADGDPKPHSDVPTPIVILKGFERNLPAVPRSELNRYLSAAAAALDDDLWERLEISKKSLGIRDVNRLSREIRDRVAIGGQILASRRLSYILLALLNSGNLRPGLTVDDVRLLFGAFIEARFGHHGIELSADDRIQLEAWLSR